VTGLISFSTSVVFKEHINGAPASKNWGRRMGEGGAVAGL